MKKNKINRDKKLSAYTIIKEHYSTLQAHHIFESIRSTWRSDWVWSEYISKKADFPKSTKTWRTWASQLGTKLARQAEMSRQRKPVCIQEKHVDATSIHIQRCCTRGPLQCSWEHSNWTQQVSKCQRWRTVLYWALGTFHYWYGGQIYNVQ